MHRCLELARKGEGNVAPNPLVGAVLVHEGKIIGEGWHRKWGEAHAEVNCIHQAIENGYADAIASSTLYVSLEPCSHFGKTPPCTDLILHHKIPKVMIGVRDPFKEVDGRGIGKLQSGGVEVVAGILEAACRDINKRFFTFHTQRRPYVILKWAQTADGFITRSDTADRLLISNDLSQRLVHQWRNQETAILVGTNTALYDNPELTTRLWPGTSPVRLVVDLDLRLPDRLNVFDGKTPTIVFNRHRHDLKNLFITPGKWGGLGFYRVTEDANLVKQILNALYGLQLQSVLVEGGARLLQSFIVEGTWDEARVISAGDLSVGAGLPAPELTSSQKVSSQKLANDRIEFFIPAH